MLFDHPKSSDIQADQHFMVAGVYGAEAEIQLVKPLGMRPSGQPGP